MKKYFICLSIKILGYTPISIIIIFGLLNWTNNELIVSVNNFIHRIQGVGISLLFLFIMEQISEKFHNPDLEKRKNSIIKLIIKYICLTIIGVILISFIFHSANIEFIKRINYFITETNEGPYILLVAILIFFALLEPFKKKRITND